MVETDKKEGALPTATPSPSRSLVASKADGNPEAKSSVISKNKNRGVLISNFFFDQYSVIFLFQSDLNSTKIPKGLVKRAMSFPRYASTWEERCPPRLGSRNVPNTRLPPVRAICPASADFRDASRRLDRSGPPPARANLYKFPACVHPFQFQAAAAIHSRT